MRQYDLCRNRGRASASAPYLLVLQRDDLSLLPTRLVAPVLRLGREPAMTRLLIPIVVDGEDLHISLPELFAIDRNALGPVASNVSALHDDVVRALDMLITG